MNDKTDDRAITRAKKSGSNSAFFENIEKSPSRRRLILSGILKGSAIVAGAAPIKSFASTSSITANGKICSISGTQSAAHSQRTNLPTCGGLSPGYYKTLSHWPNYNGSATPKVATNTVNGKTFTQNSKFRDVFGSGPLLTLIDIMLNHENTAEFHYIPALLNSIKPPSGYVFPYNPTEVINFYNSSQKDSALSFFKGYMETI